MNTTSSCAVRTALASFAFALLASYAARAANIVDFTDYSLRNSGGQVLLPGRLFTPPEAATSPTPRPLMVYLHGGGAAGTNNVTQVLQTPDYMLDEAKRRGAYLYVPQAPVTWASLSHVDSVMTMINRAVADLRADDDRLYVTGYSNGGGGTWNLLSRNRGRFAAAVTLSAVAPAPGFVAANLRDTPLFSFHARDDATVSVGSSRSVMNGVLFAAGQPFPTYLPASDPRYFVISNPSFQFDLDFVASAPPGTLSNYFISNNDLELLYYEPQLGGHTGLLVVYYVPILYDWMFAHTLAVPEPPAASLLVVSGVLLLRRRRGPFGHDQP
jgi:predicted esterase